VRRLLRSIALALLLLCAAAAALVWYYAQPERVAALLGSQARSRLGLELAFKPPARYALWPRLRLQLDEAQLRLPGETTALLTLARLDVSLPWSSLRDSRLVIEQLELQQPRLELPALQRWLAQDSSGSAPELALHLRIAGGELLRDGKPLARGLNFDGAVDTATLARWWSGLATAGENALLAPPLPGAKASVETLQLDGVTLKGLTLDSSDAAPTP
jgi:AsmA family